MWIAGPAIQPGRHGNSVYLQNGNGGNTNSLTLATNETCLADVETCINGITLAFWVKLQQGQPTRFPLLFRSSSLKVFALRAAAGFSTRFDIWANSTHKGRYRGRERYQYDQWYLIAVAHSAQSGPEIYMNGCPAKVNGPSSPNPYPRVTTKTILGCNEEYKSCVKGNLDDLRFWTSKKDKQFMWMLWSS